MMEIYNQPLGGLSSSLALKLKAISSNSQIFLPLIKGLAGVLQAKQFF